MRVLILAMLKLIDYLLHKDRLTFLENCDFSQFTSKMAKFLKDFAVNDKPMFTPKVSKEAF